jgi:hypothetical protein
LASCTGGSTSTVSIADDYDSKVLIANKNNLQQILTKEMIAKALDIPLASIEENIETKIANDEQYTVLYSWISGKKKKLADGKFEIDEYHSVSIGFVKEMNLPDFDSYYGTNKGLQMQVDQMAEEENFDKEIGILEAKDISDYASNRKVEKLEQVASAAYWESTRHTLHVLARDVAFSLTANFGDNEELAKKNVILLSNAILNP